jgi:hypothetical protein
VLAVLQPVRRMSLLQEPRPALQPQERLARRPAFPVVCLELGRKARRVRSIQESRRR